MEDDGVKFILEIPSFDERRIMLIECALGLAVTKKCLVRQQTDGFAFRKNYEWGRGEVKIEIAYSNTKEGNEHLDLRVLELDWLVFHVSAVRRVSQRKRVMHRATVHRDTQSYWEAIIRYVQP